MPYRPKSRGAVLAIVGASAVVLGIVGFLLGYYAKGSLEGGAISAAAGALGGGIAGYAALGVIERARSKAGPPATQP